MTSVSFTITQLCAVAAFASQAPTDISPTQSSLDVVKTSMSLFGVELDDALRDALAEAALALTVFGLASFVLGSFRKRKPKPMTKSKGKAPPPWRKQAPTPESERRPTNAAHPGSSTPQNKSASGPRDPAKLSEGDAVANAVKAGKASNLPQILDAAVAHALASHQGGETAAAEEAIASQLLLTALRACAASHRFTEALKAFDHMTERIGQGNASLWSVLLYIVVEVGAFDRCESILTNLCVHTRPSGHDFVNMVRCYAAQQDEGGLQKMLASLHTTGFSIDAYTMNRALAASGGADSLLGLAEVLANANICEDGLDAVGFNTLMKLNARAGKIDRCFELHNEMLAKGLEASEITYGILLDACVSAQELDRAKSVFSNLCSSGLQLNVVHCTSFMKVLLSARRLDEAAGVLKEMVRSPGVKPDLITYSTLVKAYAEAGEVSSALNILEVMLSQGIKGDEIIFNSVLSACSMFPMKPSSITRTFDTLLGHGLRPSTTTLSILLKALAHTDSWSPSLQLLEQSSERFGLEPEMRLYAQLIQACVKARHAEAVIQVFKAMLVAARRQGKKPDPVIVSRCLRSCVLSSDVQITEQLWRVVQKEGIAVDAHMEKMVKSALAKRGRA